MILLIKKYIKQMNGLTKLMAAGAVVLVLTSMVAYLDPRDQSYDFAYLYDNNESSIKIEAVIATPAEKEALKEETKLAVLDNIPAGVGEETKLSRSAINEQEMENVQGKENKNIVLTRTKDILKRERLASYYEGKAERALRKITGVQSKIDEVITEDRRIEESGQAPFDSRRKKYIEKENIETVSGFIVEDTVWHVGKTYLITTDVVVADAELTIMPGAIVLFEKNTSLVIGRRGRLIAKGHSSLPIIFAKAAYDEASYQKGFYKTAIHIQADSLPGSVIENTRITSASTGIIIERPVRGPIRNCVMDHCLDEIENLIQ